jgi:hypothetical protein
MAAPIPAAERTTKWRIARSHPIIEGLLKSLCGLLRLAAVTLKALLCCAATALSGFGVFFCPSFGW